uniref:Ig-like domain-containing protein n=1 Tax=Anopheles albimanus TaxID=7167 RepID=A0A182FSJ5_ANOAL
MPQNTNGAGANAVPKEGTICGAVPPDIINEESSADIAVQEGEDATIVCKAVGHPTPRVTWKREDGEYMLLRKPQSRELIRDSHQPGGVYRMRERKSCVEKTMLPGARCGCQGQRSYVEEKLADKHYVHICITNVRRSLPAPDWVAVVLAILKLRLLSLDAELELEAYNGTHLHLPKLERRQMGAYLCIASNDVPPAVSKRVSLSVHLRPTSQLLGAPLGSDVQLECTVEASPMPVSYWLKGGRVLPNNFASITNGNYEQAGLSRPEMLLDGPKYGIGEERHGFRTNMRLVVRSFSAADVGTYHCVSTNSLGRADGTMRLYGKCPRPPGLVENYSTSRCRNTKQTRHSGALTLHLTSMHHLLMIISSLQKVVPRTHEAVSYYDGSSDECAHERSAFASHQLSMEASSERKHLRIIPEMESLNRGYCHGRSGGNTGLALAASLLENYWHVQDGWSWRRLLCIKMC